MRKRSWWKRTTSVLSGWMDSWAVPSARQVEADRIDWLRVMPFLSLHLGLFALIWVGVSPVAVLAAILSYVIRMFAITGFYHRYFSHKSFKTSRVVHTLFGLIGVLSAQRGPLWWAAHHRLHHRHTDQPQDPHSPRHGFWHSHITWFMTGHHARVDTGRVRDWLAYPELVWLDRFSTPLVIASLIGWYALGEGIAAYWPQTGTSGAQMLVWGFVVSTVVLTHATLCINSLAHRFGSRRFETADDSRNNGWLALVTLGEGWHNNHHRYMGSVRQGFFWWEIDMTWYALKAMSWVGLVSDLRPVPDQVYQELRQRRLAQAAGLEPVSQSGSGPIV